jgi:hypothetical protein
MMDYANFLIQLVGQNDDAEEALGVKDNSLEAAIWTEKDYKKSLSNISSETPILFIGDSKLVQSQALNIKIKFDKFGMKYGWLGKRAVMYVENEMLSEIDYADFLAFAQEYARKFTQEATLTWENYFPLIRHNSNNTFLNFVDLITEGFAKLSTRNKQRKIAKQQYQCLAMVLYLEGLQKFVEG